MRLRKYLFITTLSVIALYSCREDEEMLYPDNSPVAVQFTSTVSGQVRAKASGSSWDSNDRIGVFMKKSNQPLEAGNIIGNADNTRYMTSGNGSFFPASGMETIFYPTDGTNVDFIAYYPQKDALSNYIYKVDLTDQTSQEDIDLLYSNNLRGLNQGSSTPSLSFSHQLVKINFTISAGTGITNLNGLTVTISGTKTQADFSLATGSLSAEDVVGDIVAKTTILENNAFAEAVILPVANLKGASFKFRLSSGKEFSWNIPDNTSFDKGKKYSYTITLKDTGGSVEPNIGWIETPVIESMPNTVYVKHAWPNKQNIRNYSLLYDTNYKMAYWVAYPLHSMYIGDTGRNEDWRYDPSILSQYQPNLKTSWKTSGYDRGHQIPSGDRTKEVALNKTTFYYSNMVAQIGQRFNQTIWANLESQVRTWTGQCDTMYVVTGAMPTSKSDPIPTYAEDKGGGKAAIPKYMYKALAQRIGNTYYTLAFKMDNKSYTSGDSYNNYRLTVTQLEEETGFTFFPGIDKTVKDKIENSKWQ